MSSKILRELGRQDLILSVWSAAFARALDGSPPTALQYVASVAAEQADHAVEALRLLLDVEFRVASQRERETGYMTWEKFVAAPFVDADGFAELATADYQISNIRVSPSEATQTNYARPGWATHVLWYNK